jgi:diguanylate cyclase (GGDEF)-like protein
VADRSSGGDAPRAAVQVDFRAAISDAISGIIDRDHFLQRLARKVSDATDVSRVAIYTRTNTSGDLMVRSSTFPSNEIVAPRITPVGGAALVTVPLVGQAAQQSLTVPIVDGAEPRGALVLYSDPGKTFSSNDVEMVAAIADEIAPAIAVAELHHAVKQTSVVDVTTGAYTSWYVNQRFEEEVARSQRTHSPVTLVVVKLLGFDSLQQTLGYERGDQLLHDLTVEIAGLTRVFDIVGMRSRAEYAILLPDTDPASAAIVIARVQQRASRLVEQVRLEAGVRVEVITAAAAYPVDGERSSSVEMVADQRLLLLEQETLQRGVEGA